MSIRRRTFMGGAAGSALLLGAGFRANAAATPLTPEGVKNDPLYKEPIIDVDEWRDKPERHRYVHGGFKDTELRFSMYFPPKERYQGRFFHPVMHIAGNENAAMGRLAGLDGDSLGFAFDSGGYLVESNMGSFNMAGNSQTRASAAAAEFGRKLALEMYGGKRPYGYVYGGSGGGYKTIECAEWTQGVWDGYVPFIHGTPISVPNCFTVQAHALRVLRDKFPAIVDALDPGGSGDMYAGLSDEEKEALLEVTRFGFPPRGWFAHERLSVSYTGTFASTIGQLLAGDPKYVDEFWENPRYPGANPSESLKKARVLHKTTVTRAILTDEARKLGIPVAIAAGTRTDALAAVQLSSLPPGNIQGAYMTPSTGNAKGRRVMVTGMAGNIVLLGGLFSNEGKVEVGDEVDLDNATHLAAQYFHRHQLPPVDEYIVWKQYLNADGTPKYAQRPLLPRYRTPEARDSMQSGRFYGKMIVMQCLMDEVAYPWQADWYRKKVMSVLGPTYEDHYRVLFVDNAMHVSPQSYMTPAEAGPVAAPFSWVDTRIVSYAGTLQQALRDVIAWAEKGIAPPDSTNYKMDDSAQITVAKTASERKGIQPVVMLTVNGGQRADIKVGQSVTLEAAVEAPSKTGTIVLAQWDFDGTGAFAEHSKVTPKSKVTVTTKHTFTKPGTYFPVVRVASHRTGNTKTPYALARNLARVRVVVT